MTTIEYLATGDGEAGAFEVAVDMNDTILLTGYFTGSGNSVIRRFLDLGAGEQIDVLEDATGQGFSSQFSSPVSMETTSDGKFVFIVETNTSAIGQHIYSAETGEIIVSSDVREQGFNLFNFNRDLNAISGEAERILVNLFDAVF